MLFVTRNHWLFDGFECLVQSRDKGEGLRIIQNTERLNYPDLASRQVSIYSLGFYVLNLLPSLWVQRESYTERLRPLDRAFLINGKDLQISLSIQIGFKS